ncbi:MAG: hypothetical protein Q9169_001144 [Polycauliona sp. 2 TL-2023]
MRARRAVYQLAAQGAALACKDFELRGVNEVARLPSNQPHFPFPATAATIGVFTPTSRSATVLFTVPSSPPIPDHQGSLFVSVSQEKIFAWGPPKRPPCFPIVRTTDNSNFTVPGEDCFDEKIAAQNGRCQQGSTSAAGDWLIWMGLMGLEIEWRAKGSANNLLHPRSKTGSLLLLGDE